MSDAANRILDQFQTHNGLRMESKEKAAFTNVLIKGLTQQGLNKISYPTAFRT